MTRTEPVSSTATTPPSTARAGAAAGYRPDIDGLRAVAIGGVLAFHSGLLPLTGGYTGVDVFFVISGTLIAGVLGAAPPGRAGLAAFAERRVRRLVPALVLVLAASILAATTLLPNDLKSVGLGLITAATFTANLYFASLAGDYFEAGALGVNPALHCWSLGVEAQFYLAAALLWTVFRGRPRLLAAVLGALAAASFATALRQVAHGAPAAFYLLPARFWEFMAGAALVRLRLPGGSGAAATTALAGLALIAAGYLALTARTPFPGAAAVVPCLGAALAIAGGGRGNPVSRALGARPLAALGRLSYALYLWHWPVLVFAGYGAAAPLPIPARLGLLAATLLLAVLTHHLIERPVIARHRLARRRPLLLACTAGVAAAAAGGLVLNLAGQGRLPLATLPPAVLRLAEGQFDTVDLRCPLAGRRDPGCRFGAPDVEPTVALWGNSFARQWSPALDPVLRRHGTAALAFLVVRCPPLLDAPLPSVPGCRAFNRDTLAALAARPTLRTVLLGGDWSAWAADLPALRRTVEALHALGRRVVVVLSPPAVPYPVPRTLALAALRGRAPPPLLAAAEARAGRAEEEAVAAALGRDGLAVVVDPFPAFCGEGGCAVAAEGRPLYYDDRHVTRFGAARASALFGPAIDTTD